MYGMKFSKAELRAQAEAAMASGVKITKCPAGKRGLKMTDKQWAEFNKMEHDDPSRAEMLAGARVAAVAETVDSSVAAAAQGDLAHAISA